MPPSLDDPTRCSPPPWLGHRHPETLPRDEDGAHRGGELDGLHAILRNTARLPGRHRDLLTGTVTEGTVKPARFGVVVPEDHRPTPGEGRP
ncbi:hypothetical protein ACFWVF_32035 [Streptomyces sp. NPDC058659]|uniref:hypothetical protein n=1 Tax=unclassified Streptomyces TaxID=2593676 RepID=UPI00364C372E